jgi:membrane fusion protein, multidrug efflux system
MTSSVGEQDPISVRDSTFRKRRGVWKWLTALLVLIVLGAGGAYWIAARPLATQAQAQPQPSRGAGAGAPAPRAFSVALATVQKGDFGVFLNALGSVVPLNTVVVKPRVDGQIMRLSFQEGQLVRQGELLAEIDPRPFQVQLEQAEGQLARDQAQLRNAELDLQRYRTLFEQDSIARQQLDTQEALVRQLEGGIKTDRAQINSAKLQLVYSRVIAPLSGRIGLRQIDTGNVVHAGDVNGIVVITQVQPIAVTFSIAEDNLPAVLGKLRGGGKIPVEAYDRAGKNKLASGVLASADNQIDATTGTIKLKAQFANEDEKLFPNQFVNVRVLVDTLHDATIVPTAAILQGSQGNFVYLAKADDTVTVRAVKRGPSEGEKTAVSEGLQPGDRVITDGTDKLREGAKVEARGPEAIKTATENSAADETKQGGASPPREGRRRRDAGAPAAANQ